MKAEDDTVCMPINDLPEVALIKRFLTLLVIRQKSNYPKKVYSYHGYGTISGRDRNRITKMDSYRIQKHLIWGEHPTSKLSTGRANV